MAETAIIIGAGPAGLTAAFELLQRTGIVPDRAGGRGLRGRHIAHGQLQGQPHRHRRPPLLLQVGPRDGVVARRACRCEQVQPGQATISYQRQEPRRGDDGAGARPGEVRPGDAPAAAEEPHLFPPQVLRLSHHAEPRHDQEARPAADREDRLQLPPARSLFPFRPEKNLEEFFINRFGRELYRTFFKSYTEKVWGERCSAISAEWGAQRVKGLSILGTLKHIAGKLFRRGDIAQKGTETSLIEQFLYPKYGPGQMWETVSAEIARRGGQIVHHQRVSKIHVDGERIVAVEAVDPRSGQTTVYRGDWFFSTMPVKELVRSLDAEVPAEVRQVSEGLIYRDFITVGLLLKELKVREDSLPGRQLIRDNWIYIQEPDVQVGRLQIFNNWSPYMVSDPLEGLGRAGVLLLRDRRLVEDVGPGIDRPGRQGNGADRHHRTLGRCWTPR